MCRDFYFSKIHLPTPHEAIWRRLGFREGLTAIDQEHRAAVERTIAEAMALISLAGVAHIIPITAFTEYEVILTGDVVFKSTKLAAFMKGAGKALLMGATAGVSIATALVNANAQNDLQRSVIYDATASEVVDYALTWLQSYIGATLRREGFFVEKRRFSAGYGDFNLHYQQDFYKILALDKLGLSLTEGFVLVPEKSVTAICGIKKGNPSS